MADPISIIGLVVDVVPKVARYLVEVKKGPKERQILLAEVLSTSGILALIRDAPQGRDDDQKWANDILRVDGMTIILQEMLDLLRMLARNLEPRHGLSSFKQNIIWPFSQSETDGVLDKMGRCKQNIILAFQVQDRNNASLILNQLDTLTVEQQQVSAFAEAQTLREDRKAQEEALAWLSTFDYQKKHAIASNTRLEGTATWIITDDRFEKWCSGNTDTLFCFGGPGVGKTVIASSIIDHLRKQHDGDDNVAVAYIYLDYKERDDQSAGAVISVILQQLILDKTNPLRKLLQLYVVREDPFIKHPNVADVAALLEDTVQDFQKVYIVVDAFDESDSSRTQEVLADYLIPLQDLGVQTKVLITSRTKPSVADEFRRVGYIDFRAYDQDIGNYLDYRMRSERKLRRQVEKDSDLRSRIRKVIVEKCDGMFLLARLHMDTLSSARTRADLIDDLGILPAGKDGLKQTYHEALERIRSQDKRDVALAERILAWLCYSARPLRVNELRYALTVNVDRAEKDLNEDRLLPEEDILSLCGGLVLIDTNNNELRLVHHTTQEFFNKERHTLFPNAKREIALSCVRFLRYDRLGRRCRNEKEVKHLISENPFLKYAQEYLGRHALEAGGAGTDEIVELLMSVPHLNCLNQIKHNLWQDYGNPVFVSAVTTATSYRLPEVVKKLIARGAPVNQKGAANRPAFVEAAHNGQRQILEMLIAADADLRARDRHANTALHAAIVAKHVDLVPLLLEKCPENLNVQNANGNSPLHDAVGFEVPAAMRVLLAAGADISINNYESGGQSPLFMASLRGGSVRVDMMLRAHIERDLLRFQDKSGITPLHIAAVFGMLSHVETIVKQCPDVIDRTNKHGKTALHDASERNRVEVVRLLVQRGAEVDIKDNAGKTALTWAAEKNNVKVAKFLLDSGADPSVSTWRRPLAHLAGDQHSPELAKLLFAHPKFDYTRAMQDGVSGLHRAIFYKHNETAILFLERDKEHGFVLLNRTNVYGKTPSHDSADSGNLEMARKLIETGKCDLTIKSKEGKTALDFARGKGHADVAAYLEQHGAE